LISMSKPRPDLAGKDNQFARRQAQMSAGFMGKQWDGGDIAFRIDLWSEVLRVLKPGGHVAAFSGTRTYHRMAVAIEDAGFEIRDQLAWCYGSGFPKSHDVSKGIDRAAGAEREVVGSKLDLPGYHLHGHDGGEAFGHGLSSSTPETRLASSQITAPATDAARQWQGWGTALKPAWEPICLARKPLSEKTVAANVLRWGCGALNIDATRIEAERATGWGGKAAGGNTWDADNCGLTKDGEARPVVGRWPANLCHDGSQEVLDLFPSPHGAGSACGPKWDRGENLNVYGKANTGSATGSRHGDSGSAARFFYHAKASKNDRAGSKHPTVKPVSLMQWLCRMITPPGGMVLDPFAGSGTTGEAAWREGFDCTLIERESEYIADIKRRIEGFAHG